VNWTEGRREERVLRKKKCKYAIRQEWGLQISEKRIWVSVQSVRVGGVKDKAMEKSGDCRLRVRGCRNVGSGTVRLLELQRRRGKTGTRGGDTCKSEGGRPGGVEGMRRRKSNNFATTEGGGNWGGTSGPRDHQQR